jgi:hypothetical protein
MDGDAKSPELRWYLPPARYIGHIEGQHGFDSKQEDAHEPNKSRRADAAVCVRTWSSERKVIQRPGIAGQQ